MKRSLSILLSLTLLSTISAQEGEAYFKKGLIALQKEEHASAIDAFTQAVATKPDHARAWYYRGLSRDAMGDHLGAMHDLDRALALDPTDPNVLLRRADVYLNAGRPREARADLEALLKLHSSGPIAQHALFSLGHAGVALGEFDRAFVAYDRLLAMTPDDPRALCDRGIARAHLGQHAAAIADLDRAIALDPALDKAYTTRAVELIALDRKAEACPDLKKALDLGDTTVEEMLAIYCQ